VLNVFQFRIPECLAHFSNHIRNRQQFTKECCSTRIRRVFDLIAQLPILVESGLASLSYCIGQMEKQDDRESEDEEFEKRLNPHERHRRDCHPDHLLCRSKVGMDGRSS
jgi:hypothetical protein